MNILLKKNRMKPARSWNRVEGRMMRVLKLMELGAPETIVLKELFECNDAFHILWKYKKKYYPNGLMTRGGD